MAEQKVHGIEIPPTFPNQGMQASRWILTNEKTFVIVSKQENKQTIMNFIESNFLQITKIPCFSPDIHSSATS